MLFYQHAQGLFIPNRLRKVLRLNRAAAQVKYGAVYNITVTTSHAKVAGDTNLHF